MDGYSSRRKRLTYATLEKASVDNDIEPLAKYISNLLNQNL